MGSHNGQHGALSLGMAIPRLRDVRKENHLNPVAWYTAASGHLMMVDDVISDHVKIDEEGARQLRAAAMMVAQVPTAVMESLGREFLDRNLREQAVVPVKQAGNHGILGTA